jgi:tRNA modification GTPase
MYSKSDDTICAVSSPAGEGGIAITRMSGPAAHSILLRIFRPINVTDSFDSRHLYLGFIFDEETGSDVDEVYAVFIGKPHTYTREDMVEVYSHAGIAAQKRILGLMVKKGARIADPGEFTKRAYLSGRIDLAQAESVLDIIRSESDEELRYALMHSKGMLSEKINGIKEGIKGLMAEVEAAIDFPEEDLDIREEPWRSRIELLHQDVLSLVSSYSDGRAVRDGVEVVIAGRTNVGKSSLLNALLLRERAIVTPIPGTTRDLIEDTIHIKGIKFRVTDTAGLRSPSDAVEKMGIERVRQKIPEADIVLWVLDSSETYTDEDEQAYEMIREKKVIAVLNKMDLPGQMKSGQVTSKDIPIITVSALRRSGIDALKERLYEVFGGTGYRRDGQVLLTSLRHRDALERAGKAMERAAGTIDGCVPIEFLAFELRDCLACLGEITGETCTEEILAEIFGRFCVGK